MRLSWLTVSHGIAVQFVNTLMLCLRPQAHAQATLHALVDQYLPDRIFRSAGFKYRNSA